MAENNQTNYLENDPKYLSIKQELVDEFEREHAQWKEKDPRYYEMTRDEFFFGKKRHREAGIKTETLEDRARKIYRAKYPDEFSTYEKKERVRIYENPSDDPAIQKVGEEIKRISKQRTQGLGRITEKDFDRIQHEEAVVDNQQWNLFVSEFPEKAAAYKDKVGSIGSRYVTTENEENKSQNVQTPEQEKPIGPGHYKTLAIPQDATQEEIKKAYREKARALHPDLQVVPEGTSVEERARLTAERDDLFKELNQAYQDINTPEKRVEYDRRLDQQLREEAQQASNTGYWQSPPVPNQEPYVPNTPAAPSSQRQSGQQSQQTSGGPSVVSDLTKKAAQKGVEKAIGNEAVKKATGLLGRAAGLLGGAAAALGAVGAVIALAPIVSKKAREIVGGTMAMLANIGTGVVAGVGVTSIGTPTIAAIFIAAFSVAMILMIINNGAYMYPPFAGGAFGVGSSSGTTTKSAYIDIAKTPNPPGPFSNQDLYSSEITVSYTVTIKAKLGSLTNITFNYGCRVANNSGSPAPCPTPFNISTSDGKTFTDINSIVPPSQIQTTPAYTVTYSQTFKGGSFENSFIVDSFKITADAPNGTGPTTATVTASITIGNPPNDCPSSWPLILASGESTYITQGAYTDDSHSVSKGDPEAIDISVGTGHSVVATHLGLVVKAESFTNGNAYGNNIEVASKCKIPSGAVVNFISRYAHLSAFSVNLGDAVSFGQEVGKSGNTGNSTAAHLHYEFRVGSGSAGPYPDNPPYMWNSGLSAPPNSYIPKNIPRGCVGQIACNTNVP